MAESEQFYQALQIRKVPTQLVRVQDSFHGIADSTPSNLIAKIAKARVVQALQAAGRGRQ
ncbi:MAG: hypothetical protein MK237_04660 [Gemmatimonadetes bacterium]|jgi:acylaminoacyl-peptidase|nr:hypothetical protein [Gemmatimonadota bacterium]